MFSTKQNCIHCSFTPFVYIKNIQKTLYSFTFYKKTLKLLKKRQCLAQTNLYYILKFTPLFTLKIYKINYKKTLYSFAFYKKPL